ncbi:MAG: hypothetical protein WA390_08420 [Nitrososphaeraceae archaeon]|nr:hypothetical protein [Nitrososphaeraceae archaeon]MDW0139713.1 hypothetical protein [Nitrososphaeraceae archaeon]MDW0145306.1 hypothetical protein [Nitrososphaeraceae archaeon]MDW0148290.1 hypothetical protein [Nitrososphaeraceae archaeon]MDW0151604.1 hypothetical protein [Nitrososphaeraceae archaeon]
MTKMCKVSIEANGLNQEEGKAWVDELANIYADMEIENVSVSGNKITFDAGFSGMDDTQPDDIKMRLDEYLTMNEAFQTKSIKVS